MVINDLKRYLRSYHKLILKDKNGGKFYYVVHDLLHSESFNLLKKYKIQLKRTSRNDVFIAEIL